MANCNRQQLNITCGTDVVLHDKLMFDGEVFDPNVSVNIECNLVNSLGKRTSLEYEIADETLIIQVPWVDGRNAGCYGLEVKGKCNGKTWATYADSLIRYTRATIEGAAVVETEHDWYDVTQVVSYRYSDSPLDEVDATIDDNYGEPSVTPTYEHNKLTLDFKNLRGNGIASVEQTTESTEPEGVNETTITQDNGNTTVIRVRNGKSIVGPQGIPGEGAIWTGQGEEIMTLEQKTGQAINKAMSQKAVTELVAESVEMVLSPMLSATVNASTGAITSSSSQTIWVAKISAGDKLIITASNSSQVYLRYGFSETMPAIGDTLTDTAQKYGDDISVELIAPVTGYLCINHSNTNFPVQAVNVLQDKIKGGALSTFNYTTIDGKYIDSKTGEEKASTSTQKATDYVDVEGLPYIIYNRRFTTTESTSNPGMAFYDANKVYIIGQRQGYDPSSAHTDVTKIAVPSNAKYARFTLTTAVPDPGVKSVKQSKYEHSTIIPYLRMGEYIKPDGEIAGGYYGYKRCSTPRYVKTDANVIVRSSADVYVRLSYYDKDYAFLEHSAMTSVAANTDVEMRINNQAEYIKIMLYKDSDATVDLEGMPIIHLEGYFAEDWDVFSARPLDSGYQRIAVGVRLTDPRSCDGEGDDVQDSGDVKQDFGIICLPPTYDNIGKPTRLIIYCHGAAVNYSGYVKRFDTQDLEPDYWLAEGYAVMDIEGNPFDNVNEHCCMPQAMDSYVAGYKWAIEHFNLCRDGVLLGGRSMGGGAAIMLIRKECPIPIIAACPNSAAASIPLGSVKERKAFWAEHCGFDLPTGYEFHDGMVAEDKDVFVNNWDRWIKVIPLFTMITDLPTTDVEKEELANLLWGGNSEQRIAWYKSRHVIAKCPVKFFGCNQDETCPPNSTSKMYHRMLINNGQIAECRIFNSYKDYSGTGTSAHHYDTQDPALRTTVVTKYGETMTDVPVVYVEMLRFWRRYEQA